MKILVTGGTGFIGSHVVDLLLADGHEVRVFSRGTALPERWAGMAVSLRSGTLREPESLVRALEGMDLVFHIGEIRNVTKAASEGNVRAAARMVEELGKRGIKRLVFVSSVSVAGIPAEAPATEESAARVTLRDHYTDYKRRVEELLQELPKTVEHAVVRAGIVYGPGSRNLRSMAVRIARAGRFGLPFPGSGGKLMPLVDVRDLARAVCLAGTRPEAANQTFNLTDGLRHTWAEFLSALAKAQGTRMRLIPIPPPLLLLPAFIGELAAALFGARADLASYVGYFSRDIYFSAEKARALLGWAPEHTDLEAGVREMLSETM